MFVKHHVPTGVKITWWSTLLASENAGQRNMNTLTYIDHRYMQIYSLWSVVEIHFYKKKKMYLQSFDASPWKYYHCIQIFQHFVIFSFSVGRYKTQVVNACREAIKNNNVNSLFKIIKTGGSWIDMIEGLYHFLQHSVQFVMYVSTTTSRMKFISIKTVHSNGCHRFWHTSAWHCSYMNVYKQLHMYQFH